MQAPVVAIRPIGGSSRLAVAGAPFAVKDVLKAIEGHRWDPLTKSWHYPPTPMHAAAVHAVLPRAAWDEGAGALLETHRQGQRAARLRDTPKDLPEVPGARLAPWRHQQQAYWFARERGSALLAMDMGTGKSAVVCWLVASLGLRRVLITCPLSVVGVWRKQFELHSEMKVRVVELGQGMSVEQKKNEAVRAMIGSEERTTPTILVINHESLWRQPFGDWAKKKQWDLLVVDESHRAKSPSSKFSMYLNRLRPMARRRLGLTGTPMPHSPLDAFAQCRFIDLPLFGTSFVRFRSKYAIMGGFNNHQVVGFQQQDDLAAKLDSIMFRVESSDVLDLPESQHVTRSTVMQPAERRVYNELRDELVAEIDAGEVTIGNALVKLLRLQQVACGHVKTDDGISRVIGDSKKKLLADVLEDLPQREPVVVFCKFHEDLEVVRQVAEGQGRRYAELSGRNKDGLAADATMSADCDVLGTQIQAGGTGVDLTRARYGMYFSVGFSLGDYEQSLARILRPGQTRPVTFVHLVSDGTVDEDVYAALQAKKDAVQIVFDAIGRRR